MRPRAPSALARAFSEMPRPLMGITSFFAAFGLGSLLLPLVPGLEHRVAGRVLSQTELWRSGLGPFAVVLGAWLGLSALGLLRRARLGVWATILAYVPFVAAAWRSSGAGPAAVQGALALLWGAGVGAYLLRARGPVRYLAGGRTAR